MHKLVCMSTFATVVETGSFTAAAKKLGRSKSVVSRQITELEQQLNIPLINRSTRQLRLTDAGETFNDYCQQMLASAKQAEEAINVLRGVPSGVLTIGAQENFACSQLSAALPRFLKRYPNLKLHFQLSGKIVNLLEKGLDITVRIGKLEDSNLIARLICKIDLLVCATPEYWNKYGRPKHPSELAHHNCLLYSLAPTGNNWSFTSSEGEPLNVQVSGNVETENGLFLRALALAHQGVIRTPSLFAEVELKNKRLEPVLTEYCIKDLAVYAVYPYSHHLSPSVRAFIDFLVEEWGENK